MPEPTSKPAGGPRPHLRVVARAAADAGGAEEAPLEAPLELAEAYRRFAPYVAAVAIRVLGRDDELDDLVQDVFLDAARGIRGLREPAAIKGWLAKIAVRVAVRRLRRRRLLRALHFERDASFEHDELASPDASPEQRALVVRVYAALDALPAEQRVAWVLRHVQGESLEQAASVCGCSLSTYQRRLRRAAARLQRELAHD